MKGKGMLFLLPAMLLLSACGNGETAQPEVNLEALSMEELEARAKEEGSCESVAMPDNWANWKDSWETLTERYGMVHHDTDMTSAEEIALFEAEKDSPTKDVGDIGFGFANVATERNILKPYKVSSWDSIPDWAKDPEGRWVVSYTGSTAFAINLKETGEKIPRSWAELMEGDYIVSAGNVIGGASAQVAVIACAVANGGGPDNVRPGIEYFKELAKQGRLDPGETTQDRLAVGEIEIMVSKFDFSGLGFKESIEQAGGNIEVVIPSDGAVQTGYCLCINRYAPHPHAAALTLEYMLSDEGQIDRARGFARPIRKDVALPEDVKAKLLPDSEYEHVIPLDDAEALTEACKQVATLWEEEVMPYIN